MYKDFYIGDNEVCTWDYNSHNKELIFYNNDNQTIATITYSEKEYNKLKNMSDIKSWNILATLFGEN